MYLNYARRLQLRLQFRLQFRLLFRLQFRLLQFRLLKFRLQFRLLQFRLLKFRLQFWLQFRPRGGSRGAGSSRERPAPKNSTDKSS